LSPFKFSIITPSFNSGRFIEDAIQSVLQQDYSDFEHIIIDGGSTDNTLEVLKQYSHLRWVSEPDRGQSDAINKGFKMATGDLVAWLNADEYYLPNALATVAQQSLTTPDADVYYGEVLYVDENRRVMRGKREHRFDFNILLYYGCYIMSAATFIRRQIVDHDQLLNVDYRVCMDHEYYVRLATQGYVFDYIPAPLAAFRWHDENVSVVQYKQRGNERMQVQQYYGFQWSANPKVQTFLYHAAAIVFKFKRLIRKTVRI
jgi:glycosyltransferase involved in cell wall biosynthesis